MAAVPSHVRPDLETPPESLGVWIVSPPAAPESDGWDQRLADAASAVNLPFALLGRLSADAGSLAALQRGAGDVLLVVAPLAAGPEWLAAVHQSRKGVVAAAALSLAQRRLWCEQLPLVLAPADATASALGFSLLSAAAAARREAALRLEAEQLEQRLQDRILLDRAKGLLVKRQGLSEEEAYQRLRAAARRQRRALRDVARALIEADGLLDAEEGPHA